MCSRQRSKALRNAVIACSRVVSDPCVLTEKLEAKIGVLISTGAAAKA